MNQKSFSNTPVTVSVLILIGGVAGYFVYSQKPESAPTTRTPITSDNLSGAQSTISSATPSLSGDRKSIVAGGQVLLVIDDDAIVNFFKTKSGLCDEYNMTTTPDRRLFCENKAIFKSKTRFTSILSSSDNTKIGFAIESNTLSPDKVVGMFYPSRSTDKIRFLTNYYLGNEFISFSPNGTHFVYRGSCWEAMCGLFVKDSETLAEKINLNNPEYVDVRNVDAEFVKWISDNEVEYKLGTELKRASF